MNHYFFTAKTQHENLGDAIITRELLRLAAKDGSVYVNEAGMPTDFLREIESKNHHTSNSNLSFIGLILRTVFLIKKNRINGNVYYLLNPGGFEGGINTQAAFKHVGLFFAYAIFKLLGVRITRLGCSIGPYSKNRLWLESIKGKFIYVNGVRDSISLAYVNMHKLGRSVYFPDLAFLLPAPVNERTSCTKKCVLSFRAVSKSISYDKQVEKTLTAIFNEYKLSEHALIFASQVTFDQERNRKLADTFQVSKVPHAFVSDGDFETYSDIYRNADLVFSNRLHVLLFALRQGATVFAVIDPQANLKIKGIFEDLGLADYIIDITKSANNPQLQKALTNKVDSRELFQKKSDEIRSVFKFLTAP